MDEGARIRQSISKGAASSFRSRHSAAATSGERVRSRYSTSPHRTAGLTCGAFVAPSRSAPRLSQNTVRAPAICPEADREGFRFTSNPQFSSINSALFAALAGELLIKTENASVSSRFVSAYPESSLTWINPPVFACARPRTVGPVNQSSKDPFTAPTGNKSTPRECLSRRR